MALLSLFSSSRSSASERFAYIKSLSADQRERTLCDTLVHAFLGLRKRRFSSSERSVTGTPFSLAYAKRPGISQVYSKSEREIGPGVFLRDSLYLFIGVFIVIDLHDVFGGNGIDSEVIRMKYA